MEIKVQTYVDPITETAVKQSLERLAKLGDGKSSAEDKALKAGIKAGGRYLMNKGKRRARAGIRANQSKWPNVKHTGNLLRSFTVRVKRTKAGGLVGFRHPIGNHAHLVDLGHGGRRGPAKGSKFWTVTRENDTGRAMALVVQGIDKAVYKIMG